MRAERLPDLVNHNKAENRKATQEASVTVTLDLSDSQSDPLGRNRIPDVEEEDEETDDPFSLANAQEWSVTRRLRVTPSGTYTSTYYINGVPATLTELHEALNRLRIYPEGYNVVLQGDVTSIISMNPRQRREIIDELAGVAQFDRKIELAKEKLDAVKEKEESSRIIEKELVTQRDRLAQDRTKAEKYKKLRAELQDKEQWEVVLKWRSLQQQLWNLRDRIEAGDRTLADLNEQHTQLSTQITEKTAELETLNRRVKALGEEELLAVQSQLATQQAELRQLEQRQRDIVTSQQDLSNARTQTERNIQTTQQTLAELQQQHADEAQNSATLEISYTQAQAELEEKREAASAIADASQAWVQQQTELNHNIETLLQTLEPQRTEQAQLQERQNQLTRLIQEQHETIHTLDPEITAKQTQAVELESEVRSLAEEISAIAQTLSSLESQLQVQQETKTRLLAEQREKQRQLDKLEAQNQAQQEAQGTFASKIILQSTLPGVCGLVAQLGRVEPRYQLALETAAGARLGFLVVEDDGVAAAGIELLKQKRAGRATFLPLNKIRPGHLELDTLRWASGFIDYAVNLIDYDPRYRDIFAYVFGSTAVFNSMDTARLYIGKGRIVTLEGELLEATGAMTGGSTNQRASLHFGTGDSSETAQQTALKGRLDEIESILARCEVEINRLSETVKQRSSELMERRGSHREKQLLCEQLQKEIKSTLERQEQARSLLTKQQQESIVTLDRLHLLNQEIPQLERQLAQYRQSLAELEQSQTSSEWQQIQASIRSQEEQLKLREQALRTAQQNLQDLANKRDRAIEKLAQLQQRLEETSTQHSALSTQHFTLSTQHSTLSAEITETQAKLVELEAKLGEEKQIRDRAEQHLRQLHLNLQQLDFERQKLSETQQTRRQELETLQTDVQAAQVEIPDPLPEIPETLDLEQLNKDIRSLQKRLQALEPVNMLAIEEYDRTSERLQELSEKLSILENERTELLLRVENFTTLRQKAFREAFDAVNHNFQTIFAELSDGDGYLQLDDPEDPFSGGLNLVAHPKGKPVQRLASMSGGEKSLTALSFIFSLQRYRPSPFYAFDEVDMFLDGANVERLAKMIKQQAQQAQFIVVSLRRPMIESSQRTIGVTQARGAYTQVLGIKLPSQSA